MCGGVCLQKVLVCVASSRSITFQTSLCYRANLISKTQPLGMELRD